MLNGTVSLPQATKVSLRDFKGGFTDWKCGCPPNFFTEFCNWMLLDNGMICERYGSTFFDQNNPSVPTGNRIDKIDCLKDNMLFFNEDNVTALVDGAMTNVAGPTGDSLLPSTNPLACTDTACWENEVIAVREDACPVRIFCDKFGNLQSVSLGLPKLVQPPTFTPSVNEGASYIYAIVRCYQYNAGDIQRIEYSDPCYVGVEDAPLFDSLGESVDITAIDELVNPPGKNYDVDRVDTKIFRTTNGGTTYYLLGTISNGVTTFVDGQNDNTIINNEVIFNQDSFVDWHPAPPAHCVEVTGDVAWYANVNIDGIQYTNRLYQSIPEVPSVVPRDFYVEFKGDISALGSYDIFPIVSVTVNPQRCTLYRVEGVLDEQGRNILQQRVISEEVGAFNNNSFVRTKTGLYFWGPSGIYRTDAYSVNKLSEKWDETYCRLTQTDIQKKNVYGTYDKYSEVIYWGATSQPGLDHNDIIVYFNERTQTFGFWKNPDCFNAVALEFKEKDKLIRTDQHGFIYQHHEELMCDLERDLDKDPSEWSLKHIPSKLRSIDLDMGQCDTDKWFTKVSFMGKPETSVCFDVDTFSNGCKNGDKLVPAKFEHSDGWCTEPDGWCTNENGWCAGDDCYMLVTRKFKCGGLRARSKCIEISRTEQEIYCSYQNDTSTWITFDQTNSTFCLNNGDKMDRNNIGNFIEVSGNSYEVLSILDGCAVVDNSEASLVSGMYTFVQRGYAHNQRICISCITIQYCTLSDAGGAFCAPEEKV